MERLERTQELCNSVSDPNSPGFLRVCFYSVSSVLKHLNSAAVHDSHWSLPCEKKVARTGNRKRMASGEVTMPPTTTRANGCCA